MARLSRIHGEKKSTINFTKLMSKVVNFSSILSENSRKHQFPRRSPNIQRFVGIFSLGWQSGRNRASQRRRWLARVSSVLARGHPGTIANYHENVIKSGMWIVLRTLKPETPEIVPAEERASNDKDVRSFHYGSSCPNRGDLENAFA